MQPAESQASPEQLRILVVEDDVELAQVTARVLRQAGYEVHVTHGGEQALTLATQLRPELVLLDRNLPDLDGLDVCRQLKANALLAETMVVLASGVSTAADDQTEGLVSGADGYLVRPLGNRELRARIEAFARIVRRNRSLREQAETILSIRERGERPSGPVDIPTTMHELRVHQVELELQNEELRRAQTELEGALDAYANLYNFAPVGLATVNEAGLLENANRAFSDMVETADFQGRALADFVHPDDLHEYRSRLRAFLRAPGDRELSFRLAKPPKAPRWVSLRGRRLVEPDRAALVQLAVLDITDRKRAQALAERAEQSQRLEAIGQLAGGVAHDLNNVLQALMARLVLAQEDVAELPGPTLELGEAMDAARRAGALVQQLLAFGRRQLLSREVRDLNDVVGEALQLLKRLLPASIDVVWLPRAGDALVFVDPTQVSQVVFNLCLNSRDAMPHGGTLTVETGNAPVGDGRLLDELEGKPTVWLRIRDSGPGIAQDLLDKIFEPFFTTKTGSGNSGLGLATCHGIARQHGGQLWAESSDTGACFCMLLPLSDRPVTAAPQSPIARDVGTGHGERVLVAEDKEMLRTPLGRLLERAGYEVTLVGDGEEAQRAIESARASFDLVLLDLVMPRLGGLEVHDWMRQSGHKTPVVLMTGYAAEAVDGGLPAGVPVLFKPDLNRMLVPTIRDTLRKTPS